VVDYQGQEHVVAVCSRSRQSLVEGKTARVEDTVRAFNSWGTGTGEQEFDITEENYRFHIKISAWIEKTWVSNPKKEGFLSVEVPKFTSDGYAEIFDSAKQRHAAPIKGEPNDDRDVIEVLRPDSAEDPAAVNGEEMEPDAVSLKVEAFQEPPHAEAAADGHHAKASASKNSRIVINDKSSISEVANYVRGLEQLFIIQKAEDCAKKLEEEKVSGYTFLRLTKEEIRDDLKIELGPRKILMEVIASLNSLPSYEGAA